jgi:glycine cleavage system H lipoate-binding protein/ABC-type phosphate transport system substrate-binding protein
MESRKSNNSYMKRTVNFLITLLLVSGSNMFISHTAAGSSLLPADSLRVISTPDLYSLSMKWADEYNRLFPGANIKIVNVADPEKAGKIIREGNLGFISGDFYAGLKREPLWNVVVGRDVIVPVINAKNPLMEDICRQGVSSAGLASFLQNGDTGNWANLLKGVSNAKADYYCINDPLALKSLSGFLKVDQSIIAGKKTADADEVIAAIQRDPYAIGFCRLTDVIDPKNQGMAESIRLLPIDRNGNGIIDYNEKIYGNVNDFSRGVWIGKYPKPLFTNIYSVASGKPENAGEIAFLKWVLSDGQAYLSGNGYSDLLLSERQSAGDKLYNAKITAVGATGEKTLVRVFLFIIATAILIGLIVASARKRKRSPVRITGPTAHNLIDEQSMVIPKGLYFDKTHTWAFLEENGNVKVGIDDFLQHVTGKITRVRMKSPGKKVQKGDQILSIVQNGKQLNLYSPVSGTIIEQNILLEDNSYVLNSSPYREGWIYRIEPSNWSRESQLLFMADKQREFISREFARLKDFLMTAIGSETGKYAEVMLADGGEIRDGVLSEMGPEIWEDFQTKFIDPSRQFWFYEMF